MNPFFKACKIAYCLFLDDNVKRAFNSYNAVLDDKISYNLAFIWSVVSSLDNELFIKSDDSASAVMCGILAECEKIIKENKDKTINYDDVIENYVTKKR